MDHEDKIMKANEFIEIRPDIMLGKPVIGGTRIPVELVKRKLGEGLENEETGDLTMVHKCYFCKGRVVKEEVTVDYRWGGTLVVIKAVPAGVCQQCGEKYIDSTVYKGMERMAKDKSHLLGRMSVDILEFQGATAL